VAAAVQALFAAIIIGRYVAWVWPGLREIRHFDSPPVQAMRWIRKNLPSGRKIYVTPALEPFPAYFLPGYDVTIAESGFDPSKAPAQANAYFVADRLSQTTQAINFRRSRQRLWALFNERYFEASIWPLTGWIRFGAGWYDEEHGAE